MRDEESERGGRDAGSAMGRIEQAVRLRHAGDSAGARALLAGIWAETPPDGDPFHRCVLAHHLAALTEDPGERLRWDLRALEAADAATGGGDGGEGAGGSAPRIRGFYPSLHLSLAADYHRLGDDDRARSHLARAQARAGAVAGEGFAGGIRAAIERVAATLSS
ncbi:hypothetical protein RM780_10625 [Streptomyces sp. DSM 44917]|uniref:Tetratricopeptide repeat protein n=1 Tax=Streptomyces boetiae TaxID=3075541 RepID=A0ABU2L7V3_9ACTN|nr:hypothetical protein [Streptomyces sp. DSM 44917]MDT0307417.1 hypothetical protein [Streptomyces sp. DSM 44917]